MPAQRSEFYFPTSVLIFGLFSAVLLHGGMRGMVGAMFVDDTFYYLQPAWMLKTTGWVSFDGLHETNGVQFLWFLICSLLAVLSVSKTVLIYMTAAITCAIAAAVYFAIRRVSKYFAEGAALFAAPAYAVWTLAVLDLHTRELGGLEAALESLALWLSLFAFLNLAGRIKRGVLTRRPLLTYAASLVLLIYCRLDAAFFALCLGVTTVWQIYRSGLLRSPAIAWAALLVMIGGLLECAFYYRTGGTILPVSALAKEITRNARGYELSPYAILMPFRIVLDFLITHIGTRASSAVSIAAFAAAAIGPQVMPELRRKAPSLLQFHGAFAAGVVIYAFAINHELGRIQDWYLSPVIFFYAIAISSMCWGYFSTAARPLLFHTAMAGLLVVSIAVGLFRYAHPSPSYLNRFEVALWIDKHLPADARMGSFNAGELAYFSNRTVVNLDGLMNDADYAHEVLFHNDKLAAYFLSNHLGYFVDHDTYWADVAINSHSCLIYKRYRPAEEFPPLVVRRWTDEPCQTSSMIIDGVL